MDWITYLSGKSYLWWSIIWISIITDILYLPVAYGLFKFYKMKQRLIMLSSLILFTFYISVFSIIAQPNNIQVDIKEGVYIANELVTVHKLRFLPIPISNTNYIFYQSIAKRLYCL